MATNSNWSAIGAVAACATVALAALTAAFWLGNTIGKLERRVEDVESADQRVQPMYISFEEECPPGYAKHLVTWRQPDRSTSLLGRCDPP